jgi:hypothetical protein
VDRRSIIAGVWVVATGIGWLFLGPFIRRLGFSVTAWLPTSQGVVDWSTIAAYACGGLITFALFAALRWWAKAPRVTWAGVAVVEALPVALFLIALGALAFGTVPPILYPHLIAKSDAGPLPVSAQLAEFFTWWVWAFALPVLGAWAACRLISLVRTSSSRTESA